MKRRVFLRRISTALTGMGLGSQLSVPVQSFLPVLAQSSGRKLALLVGINHYTNHSHNSNPSQLPPIAPIPLNGCVTDVELQRELLIHRFGFRPSDILTLTNEEATRTNIESAFLDHLSRQVQSGDQVLFHFSGYGSQLLPVTPSPSSAPPSYTLVPFDGYLSADDPVRQDWMVDTLAILLRRLPTDQVITVLDAGFGLSTMVDGVSGLKKRNHPVIPAAQWHPDEQRLYDELRSQLPPLSSTPDSREIFDKMPGIVLLGGTPGLPVVEIPASGFTAGLLTYELTQRLWVKTQPFTVHFILAKIATDIKQSIGSRELPMVKGQGQDHFRWIINDSGTAPGLVQSPIQGIIGSVIKVTDDRTAQVWLGGVPWGILEFYGAGSVLGITTPTMVTSDTTSSDSFKSIPVQITTREGLTATITWFPEFNGQTPPPFCVGQWVTEWVRVLPEQLKLTIGLDNSLERIERVDAISGFANIANVKPVRVGDQQLDYWFGHSQLPNQSPIASLITDATLSPNLDNHLINQGGYGLFFPDHTPVPDSMGDRTEAVKTAIYRMKEHLMVLLAIKLFRLTVNSYSSQLGVEVTLEATGLGSKRIFQEVTCPVLLALDAQPKMKVNQPKIQSIFMVQPGEQLAYEIVNRDQRLLYGLALIVENNNRIYGVELQSSPNPNATSPEVISGGLFPQQIARLNWTVTPGSKNLRTYVIFSTAPFNQTSPSLDSSSAGSKPPIAIISNPLSMAKSLLADLHQAGSLLTNDFPQIPLSYMLQTNAWTTLEFLHQVE